MEWNQRLIAFVKEADRETAGNLLVKITQEGEDVNSFSVPVVDSEADTWYGCSSACHEEIRIQLVKSFYESKLVARFVILQEQEGQWQVYRSSDESIIGETWDITPSFDTALEFFGFERVPPDEL